MLTIYLALLLGLAQYYSEDLLKKFRDYQQVISFAAGISVAYLFLELLPQFFNRVMQASRELFLFVLLGFTIINITEKVIRKYHTKNMKKELHYFHAINAYFYHFVIGIVMVEVGQFGPLNEVLFFFPILIHFAVSSAVEQHLHPYLMAKFEKKLWFKILFASSTLFGALIAIFIPIKPLIVYALFGFMLGTLMYIVIREAIPYKREGYPAYFMWGVFVYTLIILFFWRILNVA